MKPNTGKFNSAASKYTEAQIELIKKENASMLYYMGYSNHPSETNPTAFFDFKEHDKSNLDEYYGFRKDNEKYIQQLAKEGGWKGPKY